MTTRLIQKQLFGGTREFEIVGEQLNVRIKAPFKKEETLTVLLSVLNPEPVIDRSTLDFVSRVNGEPLVSLLHAKPDPQTFNGFVTMLKQQALAEYNAFSGLRATEPESGLAGNSYEEPPEFDDDEAITPARREVNPVEVETAIRMLQTHMDPTQVAPLIAALEDLRAAPEDYAGLVRLAQVFGELGGGQGGVLTYAPYVGVLLSDDPYGRD